MKVVKKTGLVPVHTKNDPALFGVPPARAVEGLKDGTLFLGEIPEGVETFDVPDLIVKKDVEVSGVPKLVAIPADWETMHHAKIMKLASDIYGDAYSVPDGTPPKAYAIEMVNAEVERRAAAEAEAEEAAAIGNSDVAGDGS